MPHLMLLRHGKSDWNTSTTDHDRPLAPRGVLAAERTGEVLRNLGLIPDIVITSTAVRAQSTADFARITGSWSSRLVLDDSLYEASVGDMLEVGARQSDDHDRVMLVGHQPTISMLIHHLTGARVAVRTATIADIEIHATTWAQLPKANGTLTRLFQARDFS